MVQRVFLAPAHCPYCQHKLIDDDYHSVNQATAQAYHTDATRRDGSSLSDHTGASRPRTI